MKSNVSNARPLVVGIGASAGGLEALQTLLRGVVPGRGLAFVVVFHLDPEARNLLPEILSHTSPLPVRELTDGTVVEADYVYTAPVQRLVELSGGQFRLVRAEAIEDRRTPIDHFLQSLAHDQQNHAVGIILSGAGSDGTQGLKAVGDAGGMTLVQDPSTARFEGMPRSAAEIGAADHVLPPEAMVEELLAYAAHLRATTENDEQRLRQEVEAVLPTVCDQLAQATGHNFKHYKTSTLVRRVMRRIAVLRISSAREYLERLKGDGVEADNLFRELLISVTAFFRDPDAFETLAREVLPQLFAQRSPGDSVRVWVPGCATGEEAYTLAMLMIEQMDRLDHPPELQIFATDIDEQALSFARHGIYPLGIADELTPERLKRFFVRSGQTYQVSKALRELVLFSVHNLINDPPFSRLDLISCRNVLIYLGTHLQKKLVPVFHYALRPGGYLFLGPSENLNSHRELFRPVDIKQRISQRLPTSIRPAELLASRSGPPTPVRPSHISSGDGTDIYLVMQRITLDEFAPKTVVVNEQGQIVCASGNLEKYVTVSAGEFHNSVTRMARDGLKVGLRSALAEAIKTRRKVVHDGLMLRTEAGVQRVMITVQPMPQLGEESGLFYIAFQDVGRVVVPGEVSDLPRSEEAATVIEQLERELATVREDLEKTVQDLEAANEELKSSNEELLSMNEELQSSNEELETSKEEVQSANDTLLRVNTDLENLLASTRVGTLFLDEVGHIRRVTPAARAVYNLLPSDVGRALSDITHNAKHMPPLPAFSVVRQLTTPHEDEVEMRDGTWFLRRVLPYRTSEGVAGGVVVTFTEVTELKRAESTVRETLARLEASERLYRGIGESIDFGVWVCDPEGRNTYLSESFLQLVGLTQEQCADFGWTQVLHPDEREKTITAWKECVRLGGLWDVEHRFLGVDGKWHPVLARGVPVRDEQGQLLCWAGINLDMARQKAIEESLRTHERELRSIADNTPDMLSRFDRDRRFVFVNEAIERLTGKRWEQFIHRTVRELDLPVELCLMWEEAIDRVFETGQPRSFEFSQEHETGQRHYRVRLVPERDVQGSVAHVLAVSQDITVTRQAEEALREADRRKDEFLAILAHELRNPLAPVRNGLRLLESVRSESEAAAVRKMMERQLAHMVRLVDDLLDVSRIARGIVELKRETVELATIVETALESSRPLIDAAEHHLSVSLPPQAVWLEADLTRLAQVFNNLLTNAAKFTPRGGRIVLETRIEGEDVLVRVTDTGMGISEQMLSRVFDMFTQAHRSIDRAQGGLGIGLGLARRLVEMHRGSITVESPGMGAGSTFTVRLPVLAVPQLSVHTEPSMDRLPEPNTPSGGLRILVVDDNTDGAESLARLFELMGHRPSLAHTGPHALEAARTSRPQVIFLDIGLPGMSGYEVARKLREEEDGEGPVLVALTGWGSERDRKAAKEAGFDHHLVKPVDPSALEAVLLSVAVKQG
jgi:two-component system CheB/CheR fusion protein